MGCPVDLPLQTATRREGGFDAVVHKPIVTPDPGALAHCVRSVASR